MSDLTPKPLAEIDALLANPLNAHYVPRQLANELRIALDAAEKERDEAQFSALWAKTEWVDRATSAEARVAALEKALARAAFVAEHLFEMIDVDTWRASGGDDGQGHYEGDYNAEQVKMEIKKWVSLSTGTLNYHDPAGGPDEPR